MTKTELEQRKAAREARRTACEAETKRKQEELMLVYGGLGLRGRKQKTLTFTCPYCGIMLIDLRDNPSQFRRNIQNHIGSKHMNHLLKQDLGSLHIEIHSLLNQRDYWDNQDRREV
ncbi:hypothetical protein SAMN05660649_05080 [Desulfotomaculum arcticum]|uniref:Uncharacterized protein n=1 Tax=Desulfotruncus arcticus DSM 17038 TaxID=1121424 RepID=A0A1I2ZRZ8_9FIRM|nr:hypothetical protein [Desulfotruncus arcticus]SFH40289.1 hypothetical protein SAMN05660649_05080 [Desulfotomaculum arcticum] [Desulfotruncus arcticus DSM 17038]